MAKVHTYNCKLVMIALGNHTVTGYGEDNYVSWEKQGDGISSKTGCDGEIVRSIDPNDQHKVKLTLLQNSKTNAFLQQKYDLDKNTGDGMFPVLIKDLKGGVLFSADQAWVVKPPNYEYGKESADREWEIDTGEATTKIS